MSAKARVVQRGSVGVRAPLTFICVIWTFDRIHDHILLGLDGANLRELVQHGATG